MKKNTETPHYTEAQLQDWKAKHGQLFQFTATGDDGKERWVILKKPSRKTLAYATSVASKDPIKYSEIMLAGCWVEGSEDVKTDDSLFLSVSAHIDQLVDIKKGELVKL